MLWGAQYVVLTNADSCYHPRDNIHADMHTACLERAPDRGDHTSHKQSLSTAQPVRRLHAGQRPEEAAHLEEPIGCPDQIGCVGPRVQLKVGYEGWLAERGADDAGAVAVRHAAQGDEDHNLFDT